MFADMVAVIFQILMFSSPESGQVFNETAASVSIPWLIHKYILDLVSVHFLFSKGHY